MKVTCHYCIKDFPIHEMRPYGPNASMICAPCGKDENNIATTERNFREQMTAAEKAGDGTVIIGDYTGPRPVSNVQLN